MELFEFGKHTPYVLGAFILTFVVLVANVMAARSRLSSRLKAARRKIASEESS